MRLKIFFILMSALSVTVTGWSKSRPNIVFILGDDQRCDELGSAGEPFLQTPNLDRLATEGIRFSNAYVNSSICMASRASIFTGLTARTHQWTPGSVDAQPITDRMLKNSFPLLLRDAGYRTGYFGKNHVNFAEGTAAAFTRMFNEWEIISNKPYLKELPDGSVRHCDEIMGDRSVQFLKKQSVDQPFFLYMSFHTAHAADWDRDPGIGHFPWAQAENGLYEDITPPRPQLEDASVFEGLPPFLKKSLNRTRYFWRWDTIDKYNTNMRARYRMITGMDRIVGRVLTELETRGLSEDTIVIYTSDNGYYRGERGLAGKWSHFEESLHVPLFIWDPSLAPGLQRSSKDVLASNLDLPASMLQMADVQVPTSYQGQSLLPLLEGEPPANWRTSLFVEHHQFGQVIPSWSGIHGARYVYACYDSQDPSYEFLHDLKMDPKQLVNLVDHPEYKQLLEEMRTQRLESLQKYVGERSVSGRDELVMRDTRESVIEFAGDHSVQLTDTPELLPGDSYRWSFEVKVDADNLPGAILMGNRVTPTAQGLNFMKITSDRGVQFYSKGKQLVLNAKIPRDRWVQVNLQKNAQTLKLYLDGKMVATSALTFDLPAMPCYLGGDPNASKEFAHCRIRKASVSESNF